MKTKKLLHLKMTSERINFRLNIVGAQWCSAGLRAGRSVLGFDSRRGLGIFLFATASRTALRPTQPPIQWITGTLSLGVKRPVSETDQSPPSSAEDEE
jgi:hypothetical protein